MPAQPSIHTIKVSLRNMKPPVWRRLPVFSKTNLAELHHIIQVAMGWDGRSAPDVDPDAGRAALRVLVRLR